MKTILYFIAAASLIFAACQKSSKATEVTGNEVDSREVAQDSNQATFKKTELKGDADFAVAAADASRLEVELGALATANGSDKVKQYGQMMVEDHTKANAELKDLAVKKGIALPEVLSDKSKKTYDSLAVKKGADFDKAFMKRMVKDHKDAMKLFKDEADNGNDPDLKSWASGKLVVLQHHLNMAEEQSASTRKK